MPPTEEPRVATGVATQTEVPATLPDVVAGALRELARAVHKSSIYPIGHPAISQAIANAHAGLLTALASRSPLLVGVARRQMLLDGQVVAENQGTLEGLAEFLHELDVAVLEFRVGLADTELERMLFRFREARRTKMSPEMMFKALDEDRLESIQVYPIDYRGLAVYEPGKAAGEQRDIWSGLIGPIARLAALDDSGLDPVILAAEANQQLGRIEGVGAGILRNQVHTLGREMRKMDRGAQKQVRRRLSSFVEALDPGIRKDLLRIDPGCPDESIGLLADLSENLSDQLLGEIIGNIDRAGDQLHHQFLNLANKLTRLTSDQVASEKRVNKVLRRWGVSSEAMADSVLPVRDALNEIFRLREKVDYNPESYQNLLQDLTGREVSPATKNLVSRYGDPSDPVAVLTHTVAIGVEVLNEGSGEEHIPGVLTYMGSVADQLLGWREYSPVRDAASAARSVASREKNSEDTQRAATGFLEDFTNGSRIERLLNETCAAGHLDPAAHALLVLGGATALDKILDTLETGPPAPVASGLRSVAVAIGPETVCRAVEERLEAGWSRLRPMFPLLRAFPVGAILPTLERLGRHDESRVRREALDYLCDLDPSPGAAERHLRRALKDPDPRLVSFALRRVAKIPGERAEEILGSFLEGSLPATTLDDDTVRRVAVLLLSRGKPGVQRLARSLVALRHHLSPRDVKRGIVLRELLLEHRREQGVADALNLWKRSAAGLIARFFFGIRMARR